MPKLQVHVRNVEVHLKSPTATQDRHAMNRCDTSHAILLLRQKQFSRWWLVRLYGPLGSALKTTQVYFKFHYEKDFGCIPCLNNLRLPSYNIGRQMGVVFQSVRGFVGVCKLIHSYFLDDARLEYMEFQLHNVREYNETNVKLYSRNFSVSRGTIPIE